MSNKKEWCTVWQYNKVEKKNLKNKTVTMQNQTLSIKSFLQSFQFYILFKQAWGQYENFSRNASDILSWAPTDWRTATEFSTGNVTFINRRS